MQRKPRVLPPLQLPHRRLQDLAAILLSAVGLQCEQPFGDGIEIAGQRRHHANIAFCGWQVVVAIFVEGDFESWTLAGKFRFREFIHDRPELGFRLIDQSVHTVAGVQQQGQLHRRRGLGGRRAAFFWLHRLRGSTQGDSQHQAQNTLHPA